MISVALLAANLVLALVMGDFGEKSRRYSAQRLRLEELKSSDETTAADLEEQAVQLETQGKELADHRNRFWPHIWLGIIGSLVSLLVNSISITYFIGTSRWTREVADAYSMGAEFVDRGAKLKRVALAWALAGITITLVVAAFGAAADPFSSSRDPSAWVVWHWSLAMGGLVVIAASFYFQFSTLDNNHKLIDAVMDKANEIRASRAETATHEAGERME